jgi:hypothetical protein
MRTVFFLVVWVLATASASDPQNAATVPPGKSIRQVAATMAPAEAALVGTIERFEEAARRLVLQTTDAHIAFFLAPDAVVRLGSRTLPVSDLSAHKGRRVKVRYTQANGRRTAHWVVISSEPPRAATELHRPR